MNDILQKKNLLIKSGIIVSFKEIPSKENYFKHIICETSSKDCFGTSLGKDKKDTERKAIGEALERYSLKTIPNLKKASYNKLSNALNPELFLNFSNNSLEGRRKEYLTKIKKTNISWVNGIHLNSKKNVFIPAQLVYIYNRNEPIIRIPSSNGAAFGTNKKEAIERAVLELIERDCFMRSWFSGKGFKRIKLNKKSEKEFIDIGVKPFVFDISMYRGVRSVFALLLDKNNKGIKVYGGLRSGFSKYKVIEEALQEAYKTKIWLNIMDKENKKFEIESLEERRKFWSNKKNISKLDFILGSKFVRIKDLKHKDIINEFKKNKDIYVVDITHEKIKKYGAVIKVLIPSLHPLSLDDKFPYDYSEKIKPKMIKNKLPLPLW